MSDPETPAHNIGRGLKESKDIERGIKRLGAD